MIRRAHDAGFAATGHAADRNQRRAKDPKLQHDDTFGWPKNSLRAWVHRQVRPR